MSRSSSPIDPAWIEAQMERRPDFVRQMFEYFVKEEPKRLAELESALNNGDMDKTSLLAHSLKGAGSMLNAWDMRDAAHALELSAKTGDPGTSLENHRKLRQEISRMFTWMESFLESF
jgi:HPt (histidine-containing phosphotransfer) domain-containing protein